MSAAADVYALGSNPDESARLRRQSDELRTLLVNILDPAEVVAEMARLARPGGWVAGQEPGAEPALCYPPLPAWDRGRKPAAGATGMRQGEEQI